MNYRDIYEEGMKTLAASGIEEAQLDARLLLEYVCHTNRNDLLVHGDREVSEEDRTVYAGFIEKRKNHVPLQHITGEQEFMGLTFEVNEHVLIPRQDTEVLVEEVMRFLHDGMEILDMCTGSGCILLSLLRFSNGCHGVGADISEKALEVAGRNAARLMAEAENKTASYELVKSDLFQEVKGKYDIIVSNPPYIPTAVIPTLMEEVKEHEPVGALDGSEDGLLFYRKISAEAKEFLKGGGYLFYEIGYDQAEEVKKIMEQEEYKDVTVVKDLAGLDRVVYGWNKR